MKSTPLNRGLKNYRKRLIGKLKKLKFLDDRPVLAEDHRLAEGIFKFIHSFFKRRNRHGKVIKGSATLRKIVKKQEKTTRFVN